MKLRTIVTAIFAVLLFPVLIFAGDVVVIGNPSVTTSTLSKQEIIQIFLGKKKRWDGGGKVVFAIQEDSQIHKLFLKEYIRKTPSQYANYWKTQIFSGEGKPPKSLGDDAKMIKFVTETPGAVGYVSPGADLNKVKTIIVK